jgi:hypothetical protein
LALGIAASADKMPSSWAVVSAVGSDCMVCAPVW